MIHSKLRLGREHLFFWFNNPRHPGPSAEVWYLDPATCIYLKYRTSEGIWMSRVTWCCIKQIMKSQLLVLLKWDGWRLYFTKCVNEGINCSCYHRCKKCTVVTTACVGEKFRWVLPWKLTFPPENQWLEDVFPLYSVLTWSLFTGHVNSRACIHAKHRVRDTANLCCSLHSISRVSWLVNRTPPNESPRNKGLIRPY